MELENQNPHREAAPAGIAPPSESTGELVKPVEEPAFGWTSYAEKINGRFAMVGFVLLLGLEILTGQSFWTWLGLR